MVEIARSVLGPDEEETPLPAAAAAVQTHGP